MYNIAVVELENSKKIRTYLIPDNMYGVKEGGRAIVIRRGYYEWALIRSVFSVEQITDITFPQGETRIKYLFMLEWVAEQMMTEYRILQDWGEEPGFRAYIEDVFAGDFFDFLMERDQVRKAEVARENLTKTPDNDII